MRVDAVGSGDGAHQPSLQEGGPLVHQAPVAPHVVLKDTHMHTHAHTHTHQTHTKHMHTDVHKHTHRKRCNK